MHVVHRLRFAGVLASAALSFGLAACGGSDGPAAEQTTSTVTPEPPADVEADQEGEVSRLVDRYWDAVIDAENTADTRRTRFDGLAQGEFLESVQRKLERYENKGIRRVGAPEISAVEIDIEDDTAAIVLCLDEDAWAATRNGEPLDPIVAGNRPFGLTATRIDGAWLITDTGLTDAQEDEKNCA